MTQATFLWELPTRGDGRHADPGRRHRGDWPAAEQPALPAFVTDIRADRFGPHNYLEQVVDAAELVGFDGVIAPNDPEGEDAWIVGGEALRATRWSRVVLALHPYLGSPVYAAKVSASFQAFSGRRLDWKFDIDVDPAELDRFGVTLDRAQRIAQADEFLSVARGVWNTRPYTHEGTYFQVRNGGFFGPLAGLPFPTLYLSGREADVQALSVRHADVHLLDESPEIDAARIASRLAGEAERIGRRLRAGLALPVIARETEQEAYARVSRLWRETHPGSDDVERLRLDGPLWAGFREIGFNQPVGLVGSYEQVARRIEAYVAAGIDTFVLHGYPQIEEIYRAGEHLFPALDIAVRPGNAIPADIADPGAPLQEIIR